MAKKGPEPEEESAVLGKRLASTGWYLDTRLSGGLHCSPVEVAQVENLVLKTRSV